LESKDPPSVISDTINTDVFTVSEFMRSWTFDSKKTMIKK
jgi:hypothetical protein